MIKVLINAINLSSAGGLTVALNFLKSISHVTDIQFVLVAPTKCGYEIFDKNDNINCYLYQSLSSSPLRRLFFDYCTLRILVMKVKPDVIFTMGNFATPIGGIKQLLLFMWPYAIYPEAINYQNLTLRAKCIQRLRLISFKQRLKYADIVAPQTEVAQQRLLKYFPDIQNTKVVPTAYSILESESNTRSFNIPEDRINLLCLTRYYIHKNVEILVEVARQFKRTCKNYRIILTMDVSEHPNVLKINNLIEQEGLESYLLNIGNVPVTSVRDLYSLCKALLLPTKLESFSATYADAMFLGKTIFTSNLDFAREVCAEVAYYFNPDSASDIVDTILTSFENQHERMDKIDMGKKRSQAFPNWECVSEKYIEIIRELKD